jgi:enoyl-CoA hydratase
MKRLARQGIEGTLSAAAEARDEEVLAPPVLMGDDVSEGLAAFEARRAPSFKP